MNVNRESSVCKQVFFLFGIADLKDCFAVGEVPEGSSGGGEGRDVVVVPHLLCPFPPATCLSFCIASLRRRMRETTTIMYFMDNVKSKNPAGPGRG